jgi:DNA-binding transcriptional LysR family regulator
MDVQSLRLFVAVAELGSFSQAGERLFLTQPAVSKRIANLERELGGRLLDRIGRQVQLTEAGAALLPRTRRLLAEMEDIQRSLQDLSGRVSGTLAMGTSHHIGLHRLPPVLKEFTRGYPEVRLDIRFLSSEAACREVELGALELAVVGRDHPLTQAPIPSLEDLLAYPALLPEAATYTRKILQRALDARGLALREGITTNYLETLRMLAVTGLGWALLPDTMLGDDLVEIALPALGLSRRLGIVTHPRRTLSNAARAMLTACRRGAVAEGATADRTPEA